MATPGEILWWPTCLRRDDGSFHGKFMLVLGTCAGNDVVFRLLTSKQYGRPTEPPCYHGHPYPSYYLGVLGDPLFKESWLTLGPQEDYDGVDFENACKARELQPVGQLPRERLAAILECVAESDDVTGRQRAGLLALLQDLRGE